MLTVLTIVGTRPEAIKMAPVLKELAAHRAVVRSVLCSAGQHREMLPSVFEAFGLSPDHDLGVMQPDQRLSDVAGSLFSRFDAVVTRVNPDWILAEGDTSTVFVAGMVAFYNRVPFGHVEAGLRTRDRDRPFPEEVHRRVADLVADLYFAPTETARQALLSEGCRASDIFVTGNTVIDALLDVAARKYDWASGALAKVPADRRLVLVTAHRRESFGTPLRELCAAIRDLAHEFADKGVQFVFPVHLNPNVRRPVHEILADVPGLSLIEPLDYVSLVQLMKRCTLVLTDSGGIQEEAVGLNVPLLVMRETTERAEAIAAGLAELVGTNRRSIVAGARHHLSGAPCRLQSHGPCPYGDGQAAQRIVSIMLGRSGVRVERPLAIENVC